jgi:iron complex transport system substrate-binding protein
LLGLCACSETREPPAAPAAYSRVVTLAPNLTELVFAAGAGSKLVGASAYSDYPEFARQLPIVGDAFAVDQEQLAILQPDLLLVWESGTPDHVVDELRSLGYNVEAIRTRTLADVEDALRRIGELTDSAAQAKIVANAYNAGLNRIKLRYENVEDLRVFYQVDRRPLYTVNDEHYVSDLIRLCGGSNIFADLDELAPAVDVEAVVERNPEVILASSDAGPEAFAEWERWPHIAANQYRNQFLIPADEIGRATTRLLVAAEAVCEALQEAREQRKLAMTNPA